MTGAKNQCGFNVAVADSEGMYMRAIGMRAACMQSPVHSCLLRPAAPSGSMRRKLKPGVMRALCHDSCSLKE
jgi:hypothetical protein